MPALSAAQLALLPGFAPFIFAGSVTPGPNNIMILASGANSGIRHSLPHLYGIALGFASMLAAVGLGLGAVFLASPSLKTAMRVTGLAYSLWLAWRVAAAQGLGDPGPAPQPLTFVQAVLFQWVNLKAWMLVTGAVAVHTAPGEAMQLAVPVLICVVVNLPSDAIWLVL